MLCEQQTLACIRAAKRGDAAAKETLLRENVSLLKSIVRRYLGKGVEFDDLFQLAGMGLLKAVNGFDDSFGVRFSTYAVPMIAGEIKRFMRDDGSVKVSRAMKTAAKSMNKFIEEYTAGHGAAPTVREVAERFGMEESEAVFILGSSRMPVSIYEQGEYKDEKAQELIDKLPSVDDQDEMIERLQLRAAIDSLPEREKKIIMLRYFRDMTQSEVAEVIGVSQVQISRIESRVGGERKEKRGCPGKAGGPPPRQAPHRPSVHATAKKRCASPRCAQRRRRVRRRAGWGRIAAAVLPVACAKRGRCS